MKRFSIKIKITLWYLLLMVIMMVIPDGHKPDFGCGTQ